MEFTPEDPRKDAGPVSVTGCIGINAYETTVVGLSNSSLRRQVAAKIVVKLVDRKIPVDLTNISQGKTLNDIHVVSGNCNQMLKTFFLLIMRFCLGSVL